MGAFDDLIPPAAGGAFDDLIPKKGKRREDEQAADSRTWGQAVTDLGASALGGLNTIAKVPAMALDKAITGQWIGPGVEALGEFGEAIEEQKSPYLRAKQAASNERVEGAGRAAQQWAGGEGVLPTAARVLAEFGVGAFEAVRDPDLLIAEVAQQGPMLGASRMGGLLTQRAVQGASAIAPRLAATTAGRAATAAAGTAGAVGTGAAMQGADIGGDTQQRLLALPDAVWRSSEQFRELAARVGDDEAKHLIAGDKASAAAFQAAAASILSSMLPGGASIERALTGGKIGAGGAARAVGRAVLGEARQEGIEEGYGRLASNFAVREVDAQQDPYQSVGADAGRGAALGGVMGGGVTGASVGAQMWRERATPGTDSGANPPPAPPAPPRAPSAEPVAAEEVLGEASQATPPPTDAERALREPVRLTALDRVQEIDQALAEAPPEQAQALRTERDTLTRDWPATIDGAPTTFSTEAGARVDGRYALVEADALQASHDTELRANATYPRELQPRERDRAASATQIAGIVQRLDPARLGASADAATGAPIIGADGLVESGNARTIALQRIYAVPGQRAEDYRQFLRTNAQHFGLGAEQVDSMRRPVLVRVRTTPVNRAEFARQANASTVAAMSPSEQAKADAARIDAMDDLNPDDSGEFSTSREFIRRFVGRLPVTERAAMIDAGGRLSSAGYARVRNAVLAKAYGDSPVLTRMVESMDDSLRNVSRALMIAAPRVAQMRQAVADGRRHDADLTPHLVAAVNELGRIKESGQSVKQALAQTDIAGERFTPPTRALLQFLADNARRPRRIADMLVAYADALDAAGDPAQGSLLGDVAPPGVGQLLDAALRDALAAAPDAANDAAGPDWVQFPPDTGTLGIPRAEMPQVKLKDRGAMVQFLKARGIEHEVAEVDPMGLMPTQAEFSRSKIARAMGAEGNTATALISADGYVLDGHHRWMAQAAKREPLRVLRFNAPIRDLMDAVWQFPSTTRSSHSERVDALDLRRMAVDDIRAALGDLADILTRNQRAAIVPEQLPGLMDTLVRLADGVIRAIGMDIRRVIAGVREAMRADPKLKKYANKVEPALIRKAAEQALANLSQRGEQRGLFDGPEQMVDALQGDMFAGQQEPAASEPKTAMINGRPYDMKRDNYKIPPPAAFFDADLLAQADGFVAQFFQEAPAYDMPAADRAEGEQLLAPRMRLAEEAKVEFDQGVIDVAQAAGALGQMIAPLKDAKRAVEKMHQDARYEGGRPMRAEDLNDLLRATIVVETYADTATVLAEIGKRFEIARIKDKSTEAMRAKHGGYADVTALVRMPNGLVAEIQINVPAMMSAKDNQAHKLYEAARVLPDADAKKAEIYSAMSGLYEAAFSRQAKKASTPPSEKAREPAAAARNAASDIGAPERGPSGGMPGSGMSEAPSSDALNQPDSGIRTNSSPEKPAKNTDPSGNLPGIFTSFSPSGPILPRGYNSQDSVKQEGPQDYVVPTLAKHLEQQGAASEATPPAQRDTKPAMGGHKAAAQVEFDADTGDFRNRETGAVVRLDALGRRLDQLRSGGDSPAAVAAAGGRTVARAAVWRALVRQAGRGGEAGRGRDGVLAVLAGLGRQNRRSLSKLFSRAAEAVEGGAITVAQLEAVKTRVQRRMANLPPVEVLQSPADLPADSSVRQAIESRGAMGDVEGVLHEGTIYLFAGHLADETRAEHVLAEHEAAHAGLRALMDDEQLRRAMQAIYNTNATVRRRARALVQSGLSEAEAAEEVIVDMPSASLVQLQGWRKLVARLRDGLRARGFERLADRLDAWLAGSLSQQLRADLFAADLVRRARAHVAQPRASATVVKSAGEFGPGVRLSRATTPGGAAPLDAAQRAEAIIGQSAATPRPLDAIARALTRSTGVERAAALLYGAGAKLLDRLVPETIKAGVVSDYGVPEAVIDERARVQGSMREQLRQSGKLLEKLATLTRAESRVAYEWMTGEDTRTADDLMAHLPPESVAVLRQVRALIDELSREAVRLGQLSPEAFERHRFAYLRRSYFKHEAELTGQEAAARSRVLAILGDQYRGRGMVLKAAMRQMHNTAPEWWRRRTEAGKADTSLKGERFERLERRAPSGAGVDTLEGVDSQRRPGRVLEVHYWPAGEPKPAKYADWESAGTWEVRDTKGADVVLWRDFTKDERRRMGEIDEARFAIAKTLQRMIHDVEIGKYLEWLAHKHARKPGEAVNGQIVEASESSRRTFGIGTWVEVPETKVPGTNVRKYGALAGRYVPGPVWNDLRQVVNGAPKPLGHTYARLLRLWKTSKTALSPAVHMNNVMSNFVMADWHDVSAGHVSKALRIVLAAQEGNRAGAIGAAGNALRAAGIADTEAARVILARYEDSGGAIGGWVRAEINPEEMRGIVEALNAEVGSAQAATGGVGVYAALQHVLNARFPQAWEAFKASRPATAAATDAKNLIDLYQAEDDVFRLAAWLRAKEQGASDAEAGKVARRSFLDYSINAPWIAAMRATAFPFISYTYRAVPMLLEVAGKRPHKLLKLMAIAGALNALGALLAGADDDEERKLLPEEKAGRVWGVVPKLIRMPWNDEHDSPVYLDVRRWIPVGDVLDTGQHHAAVPVLPVMVTGGPLAVIAEILFNKSQFTGREITLETDTPAERTRKVVDHLYKAFAPNIAILPGTYAWTSVTNAGNGATDTFGRELSLTQAIASSLGVKLGSYPEDVLRRNMGAEARAQDAEILRVVWDLRRQYSLGKIDADEFYDKVEVQMDKRRALWEGVRERLH